jgi:hypothetical protein
VSWVHRAMDQAHGGGSMVHHGPMAGLAERSSEWRRVGAAGRDSSP